MWSISVCIEWSEQLFTGTIEPWYVRLALEGEDRLERNQRAKEQESTVSYNAISEGWEAMGDAGGKPAGTPCGQ